MPGAEEVSALGAGGLVLLAAAVQGGGAAVAGATVVTQLVHVDRLIVSLQHNICKESK